MHYDNQSVYILKANMLVVLFFASNDGRKGRKKVTCRRFCIQKPCVWWFFLVKYWSCYRWWVAKILPTGLLYSPLINFKFRFSDATDKFLFCLGIFGSIVTGLAQPLSLLILSKLVTSFTDGSSIALEEKMHVFLPYYISIGSVTFVISFLQMLALTISAKRQSRRIRLLLFKVSSDSWVECTGCDNLRARLVAFISRP